MRKRLVVCLDGTWNSADSGRAETNVARIARAISASSMGEGTPQLVLYLRGVGSTGFALQRVLGGITGNGVEENIRAAYMFIARNYVPGDAIYIFGFSRGAFAARSLCGLIGSVGILKRWSLNRVSDSWRYYREARRRSPEDFRAQNAGIQSHGAVPVEFLGVWDTVGALGVPGSNWSSARYRFHDTSPCPCVRRARHALAIDEHRDAFVPTFWTARTDEDFLLDIQQVWFAGAHSDVGGGYARGELAGIPLIWMASQAEEAGLVLDWSVLPRPESLNRLAAQHDSRRGLFAKDRIRPAYRRICERDRRVGPWGWLYVPRDADTELRTIGESVHESVWRRVGETVEVIGRGTMSYRPRNLPSRREVPTAVCPSAERERTTRTPSATNRVLTAAD